MFSSDTLARIIVSLFRIFSFLVIIKVVLSYFMSPFHPVRQFVDRIIEPLLAPIRKIIPPISGIDFSPLVLIVLAQLLEMLILRLILSTP